MRENELFDAIRQTIVAGIDPQNDPPLIPTLHIVFSDGQHEVNVLAGNWPNYSRVREICSDWLKESLKSQQRHCAYGVAYAIAPNRIEMKTNYRGVDETFHGIMDDVNQSITWDNPGKRCLS